MRFSFICHVFILGLAVWVVPKAGAWTAPGWLYSVELPVENQSAAERARVAQAGLLTVLQRITGLVSVPRSPAVRSALSNPSRYYSEFKFFDRDETTVLRITFQKPAVMTLIREDALPIWWTSRPTVLVWVVVEENGRRQILSTKHEHPLRLALAAQAKSRGLELTFPAMDLEDEGLITPGAVWGDVASSVESASARYPADIVMTCRLQATLSLAGRALEGDCRYWFDDAPRVSAFSSPRFSEAAEVVFDDLANLLVARYAVLAREMKRWEVRVKGLADVSAYGALMRYVESLDFVDRVSVSHLESEHLTLQFDTRAEADQFLMLLTTGGALLEDAFDTGPGVQLLWQG
jgi:hypothetical protein